MLRLLTSLAIYLVISTAQAQTLPAWALGPPLDCAERGGWSEDGLCLICPDTQPERTEESARGDRACTRPGGWIWVPRQIIPAELSPRRRAGGGAWQYHCPSGGYLHGTSCAICPALSLSEGSRCKDRVAQSWAAAKRLDVSACPDGAWKGEEGFCHSCRMGMARADSLKPACLPDPTGWLRGRHQANYIDNPRRPEVEVQLSAILGQGKTTWPERLGQMQGILLREWRTGTSPYYDTLIWLNPHGRAEGQLSGGYVQLIRGNPHGWHCARIDVSARRSQPAAPLPKDIILLMASGHRVGRLDDLMAWLEPSPTGGISAGHPKKTRQKSGLIWEIGTPTDPEAEATKGYYRFLGPLTIHPAIECTKFLWP